MNDKNDLLTKLSKLREKLDLDQKICQNYEQSFDMMEGLTSECGSDIKLKKFLWDEIEFFTQSITLDKNMIQKIEKNIKKLDHEQNSSIVSSIYESSFPFLFEIFSIILLFFLILLIYRFFKKYKGIF